MAPSKDAVFKQIVAWVLAGHSEFELQDAIDATYPGAKRLDLLARVAEHFQKAGQADHESIRGWVLECYREIYRKALIADDLATALKALQRLEQAAK